MVISSLKEKSKGLENKSQARGPAEKSEAVSRADYFKCLATSPCRIKKKYASGNSKSVWLDGRLQQVRIEYLGELCLGCSFAVFNGVNPLYLSYSSKSRENKQQKRHKVNRFMVRAFAGVECGIERGLRFRWFVMTESDEAIALGLDFSREWAHFLRWLRYYCPDFQFIVVEHCPKGTRNDWHIISYGSDKLPIKAMREYWLEHYKSTITGMAEVHHIRKAIYYLAGYLGKGEKFMRSWCSQGWVYRGWLGDSKAYRRAYGDYPLREDMVKLSMMASGERAGVRECLLETGYLEGVYYEQEVS